MKKSLAIVLSLLLAASAFALQTDNNQKTKKGAAIGGVAGAIAGAIIGNNRGRGNGARGAVIGGVVGGIAGAAVGAMMDRQERDLRKIEGVSVARTSNDELRVTVRNDVLFDYNSAALRSASRDSLREMGNVFDRYPDTTIVVAGYTDSIGSVGYNQRLSERRADSVASFMEDMGVNGNRIDSIGYGKSHPRATNSTAAGRQLNRRVEIRIKANQG